MKDKDLELKVLLHESEHVQQSIGRFLGGITAAFGVGVPALIGVVLFVFEGKPGTESSEVVGIGITALVTIIVLFSNAMWIEALHSLRYKYAVLHPRLYKAIGQEGWENFGQSLSKHRRQTDWLPTLLFHATLYGVALSFAIFTTRSVDTLSDDAGCLLILGSAGLVSVAIISTGYVFWVSARVRNDLMASRPSE